MMVYSKVNGPPSHFVIQTFFLVQSQDTCKEQLEEKEKGMDEKPAYSLEVLSKHTELVPT